jgi:release factor glutamine methyltransferase
MSDRAFAPAMTVALLVAELASALESGVARGYYDDATREARELVAALEDQPRFWAALNPDVLISDQARRRAMEAARRRARGSPLAYAVRRASFRQLVLEVDERVLIPRPETEQLVELALSLSRTMDPGGIAIDVGTGSGAIALSLATEGRFARVIATDLSRDALDVARRNEERLGAALQASVEWRHGSLLDPVTDVLARCIVSNPPYIAFDEAHALPASVRDWEPAVALYSPGEGLALTAQLMRQAAERLVPGGIIAIEVDARRAALVAERIGQDARYDDVAVTLDLFGNERFVTARRRV